MKVGTIKETKNQEFRVGLTPSGVAALTEAGHQVLVERGAGIGSGFWKSTVKLSSKVDRVFRPRMSRKNANSLYSGWQKAVRRILSIT